MKRRDFSKALAALPLATSGVAHASQTTLPFLDAVEGAAKEGQSPNRYVYLIEPDPDGKFALGFEMVIDQYHKQLRPTDIVGQVHFKPRGQDDRPWLIPPGRVDTTLTTTPDVVFRQRRFDVIDRAINLRMSQYIRQLGLRPMNLDRWQTWQREARQQLLYTRVEFETR